MKKILLVLAISSVAFASGLQHDTDIAVDPSTGLSYFVEKSNNPAGLVTVYNQKGEVVRAFSVSPEKTIARHTEIELTRSDRMLVLQQLENSWTLRRFDGWGKTWALSQTHEFSMSGVATQMRSVDSEHVIIDYTPVGGGKSQTVMIQDSTDLIAVQTQDTVVVEQKIEEAAKKVAVEESSKGGLGLAAGNLAGIGFAYRRHFENKMGYQIAGIWSASENSSFSNIGGQLIRTISRSEKVRLFAMGGGSIRNETDNYPICRPPDPTRTQTPEYICEDQEQKKRTLNFGGGIGFEFIFGKRLGITVELPLTWKYNKDAAVGTRKTTGPSPIPAASIVYYFGSKN